MGKVVVSAIIKQVCKKMWKEDVRLYTLKQDVEAIDVMDDIAYAGKHCMDFYTPSDNTSIHPIFVLDIHGGAWVYGDKLLNRHFCMNLAKRGFPSFNMNYDLIPNSTIKKQIQQVFLALQYIMNHAATFHIQGYKICLSGDSAGVHLASLAACITRDVTLQKSYGVSCEGIHIDALLLQHGIYDLTIMKNKPAFYMKKLYRWMFPKQDADLRTIDCLRCFLDETWDIPMFLLSSEKDTMFSPQTLQLAKRLDHLHIPYELLFWDKTHDLYHVFHISHPDEVESQQTFDRMAEFLKNI